MASIKNNPAVQALLTTAADKAEKAQAKAVTAALKAAAGRAKLAIDEEPTPENFDKASVKFLAGLKKSVATAITA
jgi:hypothetical protein